MALSCHFLVIFELFISLSSTLLCQEAPFVSLFLLNSDVEPINEGVTGLSFNISRASPNPSFLLRCVHPSSPVHWVLDQDLSLGEITQPAPSPTIRTLDNDSFIDRPSTYLYTADYYIELQKPNKDHIFICQTFQEETQSSKSSNKDLNSKSSKYCRSVVFAELQYTLHGARNRLLKVDVLSRDEVLGGVPPLKEFDAKIEAHKNQSETKSRGKCPFTLNLALDEESKALYVEWNSSSKGIENTVMVATIQGLENVNRFHPTMEEHCINLVEVGSISDQNKALDYKTHIFYPRVFTYALGQERRTLKIFFDLAQDVNFYYSWESVSPSDMIFGKVPKSSHTNKMLYKGQNFTIQCSPSVHLFSQGTRISTRFLSLNYSAKFISDLAKEDFADIGGSYEISGTVGWDRGYLMENKINRVELTCVAPLWNSSDWFNHSWIVTLQDSELPEVSIYTDKNNMDPKKESFDSNNNSTLIEETSLSNTIYTLYERTYENNFTITCQASGIPLPTIEFILPKNNLDVFEMEPEIIADDDSRDSSRIVRIRNLIFSNLTKNHEGTYTCVANSVVGKSRKSFEIRIKYALFTKFILLIVSIGGVIILLFAVISLALVIKLKKERAEFILSTEEAIKKFREGFSNGDNDLGFKANSEYKEYEIPLSRWGLGNTMLGSGAFGVVQKGVIYRGEDRSTQTVAVKTINQPKDVSDFENSLMELTIMSYIGKHEHVVSLVGACTDNIGKRSILIGVEYCQNGDLLNYLKKRRALFHSFVGGDGLLSLDSITGRSSTGSVFDYTNFTTTGNFTSLDLYKWSYQIGNGMEYLVSKKILHADLAARNVLLTNDNIAKISDFGLSRQLLMSDNYTKKSNTPLPFRHMAIESLKYREFSSASDIWSYGVTLYEIFTLGEEPWNKIVGWTNEFMDDLETGVRLPKPKFATSNM